MRTDNASPRGVFRDRLTTKAGHVVDWEWRSNLVVDGCRILLAGFMKGDGPQGIQRLDIGRGDPSWDVTGIPPPERVHTGLVDPNPFSVAIPSGDIEYLDASGAVSADPTPRLQIAVTLPAGHPPPDPGEDAFAMREFALFGTIGGDDTMINSVRHPVVFKAAGDVLTRTIRLVF
jgi:hypothetical protein